MKLIIGGSYQGKTAYACRQYDLQEDQLLDGRTCPLTLSFSPDTAGIHHFHSFLYRMLEEKHFQSFYEEGASSAEAAVSASEQQTEVSLGIVTVSALEQQAEAFAHRLAAALPDAVIVSDELGYGIVPMKKEDRIYREVTGRCCICLAAAAQEVVRVVAGIGVRIK